MGAARGWYESDDYAPLRELRQCASDTDIVLVEGPLAAGGLRGLQAAHGPPGEQQDERGTIP